jgi:hypothetical protein
MGSLRYPHQLLEQGGGGLLHHSNRGSAYTSADYQRGFEAHGITLNTCARSNLLTNWEETTAVQISAASSTVDSGLACHRDIVCRTSA